MPQKSKSRSKSSKKKAVTLTKKPKQAPKKATTTQKNSKTPEHLHQTRRSTQSKSKSIQPKRGKITKAAPLKKKITKPKKTQSKKKPVIVKQKKSVQKSPLKTVSKSPQKQSENSEQANKEKKVSQLQKKQISKEKKSLPKPKSQEKSLGKSQGKKKEKSYFDILYDYIKEYDKSHESDNKLVQNEKKPYQLMEDIKIIYSVAQDDKHEGLGPVFWNELANKKIIQRPVESMRDRYKRYIRFLDKNDFDKIITYLKEEGTEGFMIFSKGEDGNRKLINIQIQDPTIKIDQQQQQHSEGIQKPNEQKSLEALHNMLQKRQEIKGKKHQISSKIEEKLFPIASDAMTQNFKKLVVQAARPIIKANEGLLSSALLEELPMMKQVQNQAVKSLECIQQTEYKIYTNFAGNRHSTQQKITDIKDLNSVVNMLHFQFGKTRQEIIDDLQDVNGNIQSLIQIYQNPAENIQLKWTNEDDNILKQCKTKDDISLKLLVRYKGEESVRNRIKFKKFVLPFTI